MKIGDVPNLECAWDAVSTISIDFASHVFFAFCIYPFDMMMLMMMAANTMHNVVWHIACNRYGICKWNITFYYHFFESESHELTTDTKPKTVNAHFFKETIWCSNGFRNAVNQQKREKRHKNPNKFQVFFRVNFVVFLVKRDALFTIINHSVLLPSLYTLMGSRTQ